MPVFVIIFAILLLGDVNSVLSAETARKAPDAEFLHECLGGEYDLTGRKPDSVTT
jgi:hypothetical protein